MSDYARVLPLSLSRFPFILVLSICATEKFRCVQPLQYLNLFKLAHSTLAVAYMLLQKYATLNSRI